MINVVCPVGHLIAEVDVTDDAIVARQLLPGVEFLHNPAHDHSRFRMRCTGCDFGAVFDPDEYAILRDQLAAAIERGADHYTLSTP